LRPPRRERRDLDGAFAASAVGPSGSMSRPGICTVAAASSLTGAETDATAISAGVRRPPIPRRRDRAAVSGCELVSDRTSAGCCCAFSAAVRLGRRDEAARLIGSASAVAITAAGLSAGGALPVEPERLRGRRVEAAAAGSDPAGVVGSLVGDWAVGAVLAESTAACESVGLAPPVTADSSPSRRGRLGIVNLQKKDCRRPRRSFTFHERPEVAPAPFAASAHTCMNNSIIRLLTKAVKAAAVGRRSRRGRRTICALQAGRLSVRY